MAKLNKHVSVAPKQLKSHISTTTMPIITRIDRVVTYLEETLPIKPHGFFNQVVFRDHMGNQKHDHRRN